MTNVSHIFHAFKKSDFKHDVIVCCIVLCNILNRNILETFELHYNRAQICMLNALRAQTVLAKLANILMQLRLQYLNMNH